MKSWLQDGVVGLLSIFERESIIERFIRTLKVKIYKYITKISKNVCIDELDDIVNK